MTKGQLAKRRERIEKDVLELYDEGYAPGDIVGMVECGKTTVYRILRDNHRPVSDKFRVHDKNGEPEEDLKGCNDKIELTASRLQPGMRVEYKADFGTNKDTVVSLFPSFVSVIDDKGHRHSPLYQDIL